MTPTDPENELLRLVLVIAGSAFILGGVLGVAITLALS